MSLLGKRRNYFPVGVYTDDIRDYDGDGIVNIDGTAAVTSISVTSGTDEATLGVNKLEFEEAGTAVVSVGRGTGLTHGNGTSDTDCVIRAARDVYVGLDTNTGENGKLVICANGSATEVASISEAGQLAIGTIVPASGTSIVFPSQSTNSVHFANGTSTTAATMLVTGGHSIQWLTTGSSKIASIARANGTTAGVAIGDDDLNFTAHGGFIFSADDNANGIAGANADSFVVTSGGTSLFAINPYPVIKFPVGGSSLPTATDGRLYHDGTNDIVYFCTDDANWTVLCKRAQLHITGESSAAPTAIASSAILWKSDGTVYSNGDIMCTTAEGGTQTVVPVSPFVGSNGVSGTPVWNGDTGVTLITSSQALPAGKYLITVCGDFLTSAETDEVELQLQDGSGTIVGSFHGFGSTASGFMQVSKTINYTVASGSTQTIEWVGALAGAGTGNVFYGLGDPRMEILRVAG